MISIKKNKKKTSGNQFFKSLRLSDYKSNGQDFDISEYHFIKLVVRLETSISQANYFHLYSKDME